ncbi:retroviral-like aspartic protease family protein [Weeksellaceae bacterium KMM 9713]|uniref:Retroviral-like aspartic protease family protein n=1 Tax=Profundicola chukchiensis TaxID=2961959 RepID=A0A9X4MXF4_9FLAO|nr:retropepsin-like aspartic protease [Profundicola chukchiensis]MDG4945769.1 retroviral-like aspartic protease family protein [Profundicola chukchiensis]
MNKFYILIIALILLFSSCERKGRGERRERATARLSQMDVSKDKRVLKDNPKRSNKTSSHSQAKTIVKMSKRSGVYEVPISLNGHSMNFIFDTGASDISISETEAIFLYKNGGLSKEDILGDVQFIDATGTISTGTKINLKKVKIGDRELHNVSASVVNNLNAPLLLGQSALSQFGKVIIDYKNQQLIIE